MFITLTTDFGRKDAYVGMMKGVMAAITPQAKFLDITHAVPPQDIAAAAYLLWAALPYFPPSTVHLVVVDPGVGTARKAIATRTSWGTLVGPDNGVFSYLWAANPPEKTVELANAVYQQKPVSTTFHGRDIFAPAAAYLARGVPLAEFGPPVESLIQLPTPSLELGNGKISGRIIYLDHFGNAITSLGRLTWEGKYLHLKAAFGPEEIALLPADKLRVVVGEEKLTQLHRTYGNLKPSTPLALVGSAGMLEIAVADGNAAQQLSLNVGDKVELILP